MNETATSRDDAAAHTLVDVLQEHAAVRGDAEVYRFLIRGDADGPIETLTFGQLEQRARAIGARLQEAAAERALLLYPPGLDFVAAFCGCLFAGTVPVPAYPPQPSRPERSLPTLRAIAGDAEVDRVLSTATLADQTRDALAEAPEIAGLPWLATDGVDDAEATGWRVPGLRGGDLALLQYTSGSTGRPKGVMVSHGNLIANQEIIREGFGLSPETVVASWLPLYHDMGLIGMLLQPLYLGARCVLMSPLAFAQRPLRWPAMVSRFRATISGGPDFAYEQCRRRARDADLEGFDLSSWTVAYNGSEPVRRSTLERFAERFASCGFDPAAWRPCYGLAEATLMVTAGVPAAEPLVLDADPGALGRGSFRPAAEGGQALVSCGRPPADSRVEIVDPETRRRCPDGRVGEIWVAGPHVAKGYWRREEESVETFRATLADGDGPFLRTGDLGFVAGGELYVTGRIKDLIIVRGRNHYPQDIEETVESCHPAVRLAGVAAFSIDVGDQERLAVCVEASPRRGAPEEVARAVRGAVARRHELEPYAVVLVRVRSLPRTTSGKLRRRECRQRFLDGDLEAFSTQIAALTDDQDAGALARSPVTEDEIRVWLAGRLARHLALGPEEIDTERPFADFGLDSRALLALSGELADRLGIELAPTLLWDHPTIAHVARHLGAEVLEQGCGAGVQPAEARDAGVPAAESWGAGVPPAEAIAVIGMGCRFPGGADDPERFRQLLADGVDAVGEVPAERWDSGVLGEDDAAARWGAFLDRIDGFDAGFFGIAPKEALTMDPQHRLLLEVAWEALEHSGVVPGELAGSATGVFVGISTGDYARRHLQSGVLERIGPHAATGSAFSAAAGRLSYFLRLEGPSLAVDTACSSSLVAVHLACQSLKAGDSELALAGGVGLMLSPEPAVALARGGMLAADGRCKTFDARADGYGRGEGCGVVVLKPLSTARRDGDPVLAVIRGTAVNQDGLSSGLTAPSGAAQARVVRRALAAAGVEPSRVGYVEAHGTGTELGDPIELKALAESLGPERGEPLVVGSVKTNIGHLEAAAGIAGLIKTVLVLGRGEIPPHLHLERPSPHVPWRELPIHVATDRRRWPGEALRVAGVSSFGFTGTNAHAVLEAVPTERREPDAPARPLHLLTLSARDETALAEQARRYGEHLLDHSELALADVCFTANTARTRFEHRASVVAENASEMAGELQRLARGELPATRRRPGERPRVAFLFTGQGTRLRGAGRRLYDSEPAFAGALNECDRILRPLLDASLVAILYHGAEVPASLPWRQSARLALGYALAELWRSWGIVPDAVTGHSVGEYAAACVAGVFSLADGLALLVERERLMLALPGVGAMVAVEAGEARLEAAIAARPGEVAVAAVNGPGQAVLSGRAEAVEKAVGELAAEGIRCRRLDVARAFHSPLIEPILKPFGAAVARVDLDLPGLPLISGLTGEPVGEGIATADYWRHHARQPVRFADAVSCLHGEGVEVFLEIGPDATLTALGSAVDLGRDAAWLPSLRRDHDDLRVMLSALGALAARGAAVDWRGFEGVAARRRVALPTYPFQRRRYWLEAPETAAHGTEAKASSQDDDLYTIAWRPAPLPPRSNPATGRWLLLADAGGVGEALAERLVALGGEVKMVFHDPSFEGSLRQLMADGEWRGIVHLWSLDAPAAEWISAAELDASVFDLGLLPVLRLVRRLASAGVPAAGAPRLWLVTRGAQSPSGGRSFGGDPPVAEGAASVAPATLWGLGRSLALEHPELWGGLIDLDPAGSAGVSPAQRRSPADCAVTILSKDGEDQVAFRRGRRLVARLVPAPEPSRVRPPRIREDRCYLITGGLGGLGLATARWLIGRGARHLVLTGRRGLAEDSPVARKVEALRVLGASVRVVVSDVADPGAARRLFAGLEAPLAGVVHAAGVLSVRPLVGLDAAELRAVCRPKVAGAWHLHELTRDLDLDFFVLFSSASAVWGSQRLAHYAAANAFLDALAHHRRACGLPATSVDWGWWAEGGMGDAGAAQLLRGLGLGAMTTARALEALERCLSSRVQTTVAEVDWGVFKPLYEARGRGRFLDEIERGSPAAVGDAGPRPELSDDDLRRLVADEARRALGLSPGEPLALDQDLLALGLDSLMALELARALEPRLGRRVSPARVLEHPSVESLAHFLEQQGLEEEAAAPEAAIPPFRPVRSEVEGPPRLSFGQQRLWFLHQLAPDVPLYNLHFRLNFDGELDPAILARSLDAVVRRHEVLRTRLRLIDGAPRQVVQSSSPLRLGVVDLRRLQRDRRREEARRLASAHGRGPFDLAAGLLFRLALLRTGERRHLLLATQHHAITDGWSLRVFLRELACLYRRFAGHPAEPLPDLELTYGDYAEWQHRAEEAWRPQLDYWRRQLAGLEPQRLPVDRQRAGRPSSFRGGVVKFALDTDLAAGVAALARGHGGTRFMTLAAAFAALLGRCGVQRDVALGTVVAGRERRGLEPLMGFFLNTLVLRCRPEPALSFGELLAGTRDVVTAALAHQEAPFDRVVAAVGGHRGTGEAAHPLFRAAIMLEGLPFPEAHIPGLAVRPELDTPDGSIAGTAKLDLTLTLADAAGGMTAALEYAGDLFDRTTAERLAGGFRVLLAAAVADPTLPLARLPVLSSPQRHQLLYEWNDAQADVPLGRVDELFAARSASGPDAVAVAFDGGEWTYRRLAERAGRLARRLRRLGVGPEVLVGICLERTPEMVAALLAVLRAGGAYVPLDPAHPPARLAFQVADSGLRLALTDRRSAGRLHAGVEALVIDRDDAVYDAQPTSVMEPATVPPTSIAPDGLAYMIYTSGSTGEPKGVQVGHRALVNLLAAMARETGIGAGDVLLSITTLSFDIAALEIFLPLLRGGCLRLVPDEVTADGPALLEHLRSAPPVGGRTFIQATPTTCRMLVAAGWPEGSAPPRLLCGGEALTPELARELARRGERVWNVYGPTETTVWSASWRLPVLPETAGRDADPDPVKIGRPLANTRLLALDGDLAPVPSGAVGELWIAGAGLARGYGGRPRLTAERFVPDPLGGEPGGRLYRTGDLARPSRDGTLECLGRVDDQVKIRGHRVELGEIEAALGRHPEVRECAATARSGRLVAYVVPAGKRQPAPAELRRYLEARLPAPMMPSVYVTLASLPQTANRKLDRRALPSPESRRPATDATFEAPRDAVERRLADLWSRLLEVSPVGIHDDFFELGGTSLESTLLASRIRDAFAVELPLAAFLQATTVARLAEVVRHASASPADTIRRVDRRRYRRKPR